jgi:hypothetical protein
MDEKRKFSRVPFLIKVKVNWRDKQITGEIGNLSLRGMFIQMPPTIPMGESLVVNLQLTGDSSDLKVSIGGKVVRDTPEGIGIEFEQIDLDSFIHLRNIVAYNSGNADHIDEEFLDFVKHKGSFSC